MANTLPVDPPELCIGSTTRLGSIRYRPAEASECYSDGSRESSLTTLTTGGAGRVVAVCEGLKDSVAALGVAGARSPVVKVEPLGPGRLAPATHPATPKKALPAAGYGGPRTSWYSHPARATNTLGRARGGWDGHRGSDRIQSTLFFRPLPTAVPIPRVASGYHHGLRHGRRYIMVHADRLTAGSCWLSEFVQ